MNAGHTKLIRLIVPSGEWLCLELGGDEIEFKDLISSLTGLPCEDIKGIKDKYGNHYTISSAISNSHINSELSDYFFLVCNSGDTNPKPVTDNYKQRILPNAATVNMDFSQGSKRNSCNFFPSQDCNFVPIRMKNEPRWEQEQESLMKPKKYFNEIDNDFAPDIRGNSSKYQLLVKPQDRSQKPSCNTGKELLIEWFLQFSQQLIEKNQIDEKYFHKLQQLILEENEVVFSLISNFLQDMITYKTLIAELEKILHLSVSENRPISPTFQKSKMVSTIDSLQSFFENNDLVLLRQLMEYDNEFIIGAFEVYESDQDFENLVDSLKRLISHQKRKAGSIFPEDSNQNAKMNKKSSAKKANDLSIANMKVTEQEQVEKASDTNPTIKATNSNEVEINACVSIFDKEVEARIMNKLHTEQKVVFKYALKGKLPEMEVFIRLYNLVKNEEVLIKPIKEYCNRFISDIITKNFTETQLEKFVSLMKARDKVLLKFFTDFASHNSIELLEKEIQTHMKHLEEEFDSECNSSLSEKDENESEVKEKKFRGSTETSGSTRGNKPDSKSKSDLDKKIEYFIQVISSMSFTDIEKKEIIKLLKEKDKQALDIIEEQGKKKNLISLRSSLISLIKKKNTVEIPMKVLNDNNPSGKKKILTHLKDRENNNKVGAFNPWTSPNPTFELVLSMLENEKRIASSESSFLLKRYKLRDEMLNSFWEVYQYNSNIEELLESLRIYLLSKKKKRKNTVITNTNGKTPISVTNTKRDLMDFLRTNEKKAFEKDEIKKKQKKIIELLSTENMIDRESTNFIIKKIDNEDDIVTSAFEIFSVTKDHWEFCDTLNMITDIYNNQTNEPANERNNRNESTAETIFDQIIQKGPYKDKERELLKRKFNEKDEMLMSALEVYEKFADEEELKDTFCLIIKKSMKNESNPENIFDQILQKGSYKDKEREILKRKFNEKDEMLMSALEVYEKFADEEELKDTFGLIIKKSLK